MHTVLRQIDFIFNAGVPNIVLVSIYTNVRTLHGVSSLALYLWKNLTNLAHILGQDLKEGSSRSHALFQVQKNPSLKGIISQDFYHQFFQELIPSHLFTAVFIALWILWRYS